MATQCTDSETFYKKLEELKSTSKNKSSSLEVYINDSFYEKAYQWLKPKPQGESSILINRTDKRQIIEKRWRVTSDIDAGKILHKQNRYLVLKKELFAILASSHSAMVHQGRSRQDGGLQPVGEKALFRNNTEVSKHVHINVQPTPTTKESYRPPKETH